MSAKGQTAAMQAQAGAVDASRRSYWRSVAMSTLMRHAVLHGIVDYGTTQTSALPKRVADVMLPLCQQLVDEACRGQDSTAYRHSSEQHINRELWNALKPYRTDRVPPLRDERSALHFQD